MTIVMSDYCLLLPLIGVGREKSAQPLSLSLSSAAYSLRDSVSLSLSLSSRSAIERVDRQELVANRRAKAAVSSTRWRWLIGEHVSPSLSLDRTHGRCSLSVQWISLFLEQNQIKPRLMLQLLADSFWV
ncbi:hypothetical protein ACB094_12G147400 [Castanea mollissima]